MSVNNQIDLGVYRPQVDVTPLVKKVYETEAHGSPLKTEQPAVSISEGNRKGDKVRYVQTPTSGRSMVDYLVSSNIVWGGEIAWRYLWRTRFKRYYNEISNSVN